MNQPSIQKVSRGAPFVNSVRECHLNPTLPHRIHQSRSNDRYWTASDRCSGRIDASSARSDIVRDTFKIRSYARALNPNRCIAIFIVRAIARLGVMPMPPATRMLG